MESAEAPLRALKINHVIHTHVEGIKQHSDGTWWVHFAGSRESLCFGNEKPYVLGDQVKITFEKVSK